VCRPRVSAHVDVGRHFETETDIAIRGIDPLHGLPPRSSIEGSAGRPIRSHHRRSALAAESDGSGGGDRLDHETKVEKIMNFIAPPRHVDARQRGTSSGCDVRRRGRGAQGDARAPSSRRRSSPACLDRRCRIGREREHRFRRVPATRERRMGRARASRRGAQPPGTGSTVPSVRGEANSTASFAPPASSQTGASSLSRRAGASPRTGRRRSRPTR
jgi:hypothetical protein